MHKQSTPLWHRAPEVMVALGGGMTVVTVILRVVLMPFLRDGDTGRFLTNYVAIAVVVATLLALAFVAPHAYRRRVDIPDSHALPTAIAAIVAGGILGVSTICQAVRWFTNRTLPEPGQLQVNTLTMAVLYGMLVFGILGAIGLIRWGLQVAAECGTRRGMGAWGMLAPVMWAWFRLAWYEMAYASTVGWSEKFFDFLMVIAQMLFLFKLARFVSGIGKATTGEMLFYAMGAALFSLSGPLTRVLLFFFDGAEAYTASALAGFADFGIGAVAFVFAWSLATNCYKQSVEALVKDEELAEDDTPYDPLLEPLLVLDNEGEEYNQP